MTRAILRPTLQVCSVVQNCLAEAFLLQLLGTDARIHPLNLTQYAQLSPARRREVVFIIDQFGLEIPLSQCLRQLRDHSANAKFLVLDDQKSKEEIVRLLIKGAHGFVSHSEAARTLIPAIACVAANQLWVPPDVLPEFLREVSSVLQKNTRARQSTTPRLRAAATLTCDLRTVGWNGMLMRIQVILPDGLQAAARLQIEYNRRH